MKQKIINPETGRLVNRTGTIGRRLTRMKEVHTDQSRYKWVINQWDWWSTQTNKVRQEVVRSGWWDTSLNDISGNKGKYPFYVMRRRAPRFLIGGGRRCWPRWCESKFAWRGT